MATGNLVYFAGQKKGGDVTVYIGDDVYCSMETEYSLISNDYEIVTVSFCNTYLIAIYRPPSGNATRFFEYLDHVLAYVSTSSKKIIVTGDIIINLLSNSPAKKEFSSLMSSYCCENFVKCATRITVTHEARARSLLYK